MASRIVKFNMIKICGVPEGGNVPEEVAHPSVEVGVARADIADVALEVLNVDWVKADDGYVESDISLSETGAVIIWSLGLHRGKMSLGAVEGAEQGAYVAKIGDAGCGKTGLIDAVIDEVVCPSVGLFNGSVEIFRKEVDGRMTVRFWEDRIELDTR